MTTKKAKAIFKFNGGNPVILCSKCIGIIKYYRDFTDKERTAIKGDCDLPEQFCEKCKQQAKK